VLDLAGSAADTPPQTVATYTNQDPSVTPGMALWCGDALVFHEAVRDPATGKATQSRFWRLDADGRMDRLAAFSDFQSIGHAWDGGHLTLACLRRDGTIWCYSRAGRSLVHDAAYDCLGQAAVAKGLTGGFRLARDFAVFHQRNTGYWCIARDGTAEQIAERNIARFDAAGRPRSAAFAALQDLWLTSPGGSRQLADRIFDAACRREARLAAPDAVTFTSMPTLIDDTTVIIGDKHWQRINIIRWVGKAGH
jgi:hypothetical protein